MKESLDLLTTVVLFVLIYLTLAKNTYAYLDPGTGSYLIQILFAVFFSSLFFVKKFWQSIKQVIGSLFQKETVKDEK